MKYKETKNLELKEQLTNTFLKTVSAFSNQNGGTIIFGVNDKGKTVGIKNLDEYCDKIERKIIDTIKPIPYFSLEIDHKEKIIKVIVEKGNDVPYFYKNKSYLRQGISTIEADNAFLKRLILDSKNIKFEDLEAYAQDYKFSYLKNKLNKYLNIEKFNNDIAVTLGLKNIKGYYNNAGALLADNNTFNVIDTVKFDHDNQHFTYRKSFNKCSILKATDEVINIFEDLYSYEKVEGKLRVKHYTVPIEAFREALINAVIHRD